MHRAARLAWGREWGEQPGPPHLWGVRLTRRAARRESSGLSVRRWMTATWGYPAESGPPQRGPQRERLAGGKLSEQAVVSNLVLITGPSVSPSLEILMKAGSQPPSVLCTVAGFPAPSLMRCYLGSGTRVDPCPSCETGGMMNSAALRETGLGLGHNFVTECPSQLVWWPHWDPPPGSKATTQLLTGDRGNQWVSRANAGRGKFPPWVIPLSLKW